ncbi:hypothetical protein GCM10010910_29320 [Microbacterium nanhaiense]|uniref:Uncharacterized protein n=1 Tax=Microbacterium nanhaiense TaxID=1301026 RepID=A0ABQ2N3W4_9MICO|nr:hypothetical protein GCM10010910_29320 [Microbacterium nanhaiense]
MPVMKRFANRRPKRPKDVASQIAGKTQSRENPTLGFDSRIIPIAITSMSGISAPQSRGIRNHGSATTRAMSIRMGRRPAINMLVFSIDPRANETITENSDTRLIAI